MRQKADREKTEQAQLAASMEQVEAEVGVDACRLMLASCSDISRPAAGMGMQPHPGNPPLRLRARPSHACPCFSPSVLPAGCSSLLQARKKFEADRKAEEEHRKKTLGSWEWNEAAGGWQAWGHGGQRSQQSVVVVGGCHRVVGSWERNEAAGGWQVGAW